MHRTVTAASTDCDAADLVEFVTPTSDSPEVEPGYEEEPGSYLILGATSLGLPPRGLES